MLNEDIHSCSWYRDKPECIKRQRDELRQLYIEISDPNHVPDEGEKSPTVEQLLMHLIEVQINLTNTMNDVAMSNYALVQAMAGEDEEDGDKGSPYQTLGGEEP